MKFMLLYTCDELHSIESMQPYYIADCTKTAKKRLLNAIREGIQNGVFAYESDELEKSEQLARFEKDAKGSFTLLFLQMHTSLKYGDLQYLDIHSGYFPNRKK